MTVQNARGYIHGLFSYTVEEHLRHGGFLAVENFIVLDLFDMAGAADELLNAMDRVADDLGCSAIHTTCPTTIPAFRLLQLAADLLPGGRPRGGNPPAVQADDRPGFRRRRMPPTTFDGDLCWLSLPVAPRRVGCGP